MATSRVRPNRNTSTLALSGAAAVAVLLPTPSAHAISARYRLQVVRAEGAANCAATATLEREVSQRLGRNPFAEDGERGIEIVMERTETSWRARLYLRIDPSEADAARVLESDAADCAELGKSVALAVSLAIAPELPPLEPKPEPKAQLESPRATAPLPPPATWHGAASLRALWSPHLLPSSSAGAALAVTLRGDLFGASFGGIFYPESRLRRDGAALGFGISAGYASGCLWARTHSPEVWSCLGARVGVLHSVVYSPEPEHPGDRFWGAASTELGLRQALFGRAYVEGGAAAVFPLVRQRFLVDATSSPIYQQGAAVVEAFVGLGVRLD